MKLQRKRLDLLLVERGLCESRTLAQALILAGKVRVGTEIRDKPGQNLPVDIQLVLESPPRFVGRGGEKLEGFLEKHPVETGGLHGLDLGASTGGFTDCLLQRGAVSMTCVDVGHGQMHQKLRDDPRVTNLEKVNARNLLENNLPRAQYGIVVLDLSFISLRKVLPVAWQFLEQGGHLVALVKPQFEATKKEADKGRGVICDSTIHDRIINELKAFITSEFPDSHLVGIEESTIKGAKGNTEFLLGLRRGQLK
jgi:23S rRNA (cytidine1920-2'-O)/16S rRNA (cytidine1409-2'-O)-methyltransferase